MKIKNEKQLKNLLSKAEKEDVPSILGQWMSGSEWGTEVEAFKLIQFIKIWDQFNIKMKGRDKRTAMINANINYRILAHFSGLAKKGSTLKPHSEELLSYGLFGPDGMPNNLALLDDQIVQSALCLSSNKKVESVRKASMRLGVDRTTIRVNRQDQRYSDGVDLTVKVLKKINKKHGF